jgi:hypothetical protein
MGPGPVLEPGHHKRQGRSKDFCSRCDLLKEIVTHDQITGEKFCDACRQARKRSGGDKMSEDTTGANTDIRKRRDLQGKALGAMWSSCNRVGVPTKSFLEIKRIIRPRFDLTPDLFTDVDRAVQPIDELDDGLQRFVEKWGKDETRRLLQEWIDQDAPQQSAEARQAVSEMVPDLDRLSVPEQRLKDEIAAMLTADPAETPAPAPEPLDEW